MARWRSVTCSGRTNRRSRPRRAIRSTCSPAPTTTARSTCRACRDDEIGDAWLGLFKSFDGGQRWTSNLLPGYPQDDLCPAEDAEPRPARCAINGYDAGADPVVRAGTNGLIYYSGLAFDRSCRRADVPGKSAIFVSRFIDNNNKENGDTFQYLGTRKLRRTPAAPAATSSTSRGWRSTFRATTPRCTIVTPS